MTPLYDPRDSYAAGDPEPGQRCDKDGRPEGGAAHWRDRPDASDYAWQARAPGRHLGEVGRHSGHRLEDQGDGEILCWRCGRELEDLELERAWPIADAE